VQLRRLSDGLEILAPAKVNLFLEVLGRRADGFHEIETLMAPVSLFDTLQIRDDPTGQLNIHCRWAPGLVKAVGVQALACQQQAKAWTPTGRFTANGWESLPQDETNLALRAVALLRERTGVDRGAKLTLTKRIPSAAGLGGGSSDAAAALVAANELWQLGQSPNQLSALAAEIGSDVPFFLDRGPTVCRGRGERIEPLARCAPLDLVIACPPDGLSTAEVYRHCRPGAPPRSAAPLDAALAAGDFRAIRAAMFNRLESAAAELSPWINRLRCEFAAVGCISAQMSGSGTSYFGLCHHVDHARRVAEILRGRGYDRTFAVRAG
jgi:4-diphosphocytidyl-2-C-methyl-D-erythritol kinase